MWLERFFERSSPFSFDSFANAGWGRSVFNDVVRQARESGPMLTRFGDVHETESPSQSSE
jgi:hypothetical protein